MHVVFGEQTWKFIFKITVTGTSLESLPGMTIKFVKKMGTTIHRFIPAGDEARALKFCTLLATNKYYKTCAPRPIGCCPLQCRWLGSRNDICKNGSTTYSVYRQRIKPERSHSAHTLARKVTARSVHYLSPKAKCL